MADTQKRAGLVVIDKNGRERALFVVLGAKRRENATAIRFPLTVLLTGAVSYWLYKTVGVKAYREYGAILGLLAISFLVVVFIFVVFSMLICTKKPTADELRTLKVKSLE